MKKKVQLDLEDGDDLVLEKSGFVEEYLVPPTFDEDGVQASSGIGVDGKEYPDPVPMAPPVGYAAPPNIMDMIRSMVRSEALKRLADEQGFDNFDEANDFDLPDDPIDPRTPYESDFEPPVAERPSTPAVSPSPVTAVAEAGVASPPPGKVELEQKST